MHKGAFMRIRQRRKLLEMYVNKALSELDEKTFV